MKQVKSIMMAAGETTGKVCMMTPVLATQKRSRSKAAIHRVTPYMDNLVE